MTGLVGIINFTPDSFSGDGLAGEVERALARIDALVEEGAAVIDIGAESTRPGAVLLSAEEEWQRLSPLMESLGSRLDKVQFSLDTRHAATAMKAAHLGFHWINDVSGASDPKLITQLKNCTFVMMHSLSVPADPQKTLLPGADPTEAVLAWAEKLLSMLESQNIARSRIIIDPGIGFGKTAEQSFALIKNIARFKTLGVKLMVGHSRKSFLSLFTDKKSADRDAETLEVSYFLASQGVDYLRVHDVGSHAAMLRIRAAL